MAPAWQDAGCRMTRLRISVRPEDQEQAPRFHGGGRYATADPTSGIPSAARCFHRGRSGGGFQINTEFNGAVQEGVGRATDGEGRTPRSAAGGYLNPIKDRKNLRERLRT